MINGQRLTIAGMIEAIGAVRIGGCQPTGIRLTKPDWEDLRDLCIATGYELERRPESIPIGAVGAFMGLPVHIAEFSSVEWDQPR